MNGTKLVVNASLLLAATARARCVFVHVAVSDRLPSPRALRLNAYIYQCGGRSGGVAASSVATAGFFPLDLGFFGVVWVSGYFCQ